MIKILSKEDCCGCHACLSICPANCIQMEEDVEGFLYPIIDEDACSECGLCDEICPMTDPQPQGDPPIAYAAWHHNEYIRGKSSSGGVFSALMMMTFHQNGVVFGAAFDESMVLRHQSAKNQAESVKFRGSKYLQSIIGDAYNKAKNFLSNGRKVLFSGTPCQIAGLYAFLGNDDDRLLTCDLVCHGVPSPKVFRAYLAQLERHHKASVKTVSFRDKDTGWKKFSLSLSFENGREYRRTLIKDPFMVGFLKDIYLRPSCHQCKFSRIPRIADISLGDFWGVDRHHPEWDDDKGTSLVLIQTEKGKEAMADCHNNLVFHESDIKTAIQSNPCICGSVAPSPDREFFFKDLDCISFEKVMKRYMSYPPLWRRAVSRAKRYLGHGLQQNRPPDKR
jgi:coenzyme F420-reducing hydrogenase beta subunit